MNVPFTGKIELNVLKESTYSVLSFSVSKKIPEQNFNFYYKTWCLKSKRIYDWLKFMYLWKYEHGKCICTNCKSVDKIKGKWNFGQYCNILIKQIKHPLYMYMYYQNSRSPIVSPNHKMELSIDALMIKIVSRNSSQVFNKTPEQELKRIQNHISNLLSQSWFNFF